MDLLLCIELLDWLIDVFVEPEPPPRAKVVRRRLACKAMARLPPRDARLVARECFVVRCFLFMLFPMPDELLDDVERLRASPFCNVKQKRSEEIDNDGTETHLHFLQLKLYSSVFVH